MIPMPRTLCDPGIIHARVSLVLSHILRGTSNQMSLVLDWARTFSVTVGAEYPKRDRLGPIQRSWTANEAE
jgi:hypothetical protein